AHRGEGADQHEQGREGSHSSLLSGPGGRVWPTVGDYAAAVNVQGCRISVCDCDSLCHALAVQMPKDPRERSVVLVVDDDDGVREALHLVLDADFEVVVTTH